MEWLEAMLAFAVVMMVFATFVSAIIEVLHRVTRIREDGLESMMIQVYQKIILPEIQPDKQQQDSLQNKFVDRMTETRLLPLPGDAGLMRKFVYKTVNAERLMSLPTQKFLERFIQTDEGKKLIQDAAQKGKTQAQATLKIIADQYEDFGDSANDFFTRRARLLSAAIAILLAICVNLDAFMIFKTFLSDNDVRQAMIEKGDAVSIAMLEAEKKLEETRSGKAEGEAVNPDVIKAELENIAQSIKSLEAVGIPIGWDKAVWKTASYRKADNNYSKSIIILGWIFSVLLGGVLVGLGGPFWYNIFRKLGLMAGIPTPNQPPVQPDAPGQAQNAGSSDALLDQIMETPPPKPQA